MVCQSWKIPLFLLNWNSSHFAWKNSTIGSLFKINNVCNNGKKANIYLVPGSKATVRKGEIWSIFCILPICLVHVSVCVFTHPCTYAEMMKAGFAWEVCKLLLEPLRRKGDFSGCPGHLPELAGSSALKAKYLLQKFTRGPMYFQKHMCIIRTVVLQTKRMSCFSS